MATTVYSIEEIELYDESVVKLRPLPIKYLKEFMKKLQNMETVKTDEEGLDQLVELAAFCLNSLDKDNPREDFDEVLDLETAYRVVEVCGGVKLNDPNLIAAAQEIAAGQVGRN